MRTPCTQCGHLTTFGTADIFAEDNRHVVCPRLPDPVGEPALRLTPVELQRCGPGWAYYFLTLATFGLSYGMAA
jgi:hypothetical protein